MRSVLGVIRILSLILYTGTTFSIYFIVLLFLRLFGIQYEPWRNFFMQTWARGVTIIFNMHVTAEGAPPKPPFFVVSNHLGYLDIVVLNRILKCTFVAKKDVRGWPFLGFMVNAVGVIFVDRSRRTDVARVNKLLAGSLNQHQGMILFPEGTSSGGFDILPFHSSLLELPAKGEYPVHVATIYYETGPADPPALESICFFGNRESFTSHVWKFAKTKRINCTLRFSNEPVQHQNRKELAEKLRQKMMEMFNPTSTKEEETKVSEKFRTIGASE